MAEDHPDMEGTVEFQNVNASISTVTEVLHDMSFDGGARAAPWPSWGPQAQAKPRMINLLARCYDVSGGTRAGGRLTTCRTGSSSSSGGGLGVATQDVFLFSDTVDGNIAFGNQAVDRRTACTNTPASPPQMNSSRRPAGGIRYHRSASGASACPAARSSESPWPGRWPWSPRILIMDDTTSALDSETEHYIQQQLRHLPFPCTKIIIGQRISAVKDADQILVLRGRQNHRAGHP